jgi:hypothetical protein
MFAFPRPLLAVAASLATAGIFVLIDILTRY